ncbi:hypothetical protein BH09ACT10_BH09ACT10_10930 [soil metagenome]
MNAAEFTTFFRDVFPGLLRYLTRLTSPDVAQEVSAETMATMWRKGVKTPVDAQEWLELRSLTYRVAEGHIRNSRRSSERQLLLKLKLVTKVGRDADPVPDIADAFVERTVSSVDLSVLDEDDRLLLALIVDGFSRPDIAAILECSEAAVKMRLMRARKRLRDALVEEDESRAQQC